jgi:serine/threonine-protein kinase HipA
MIPGDINHTSDYHHYLVKLHLDEELGYHRERIEYAYYHTTTQLGIEMSDSKLMDDKHFATLRFDRINGRKIHVLTASGLTGWDFKDPLVSSYENLFDLALFLKLPHVEIEQLFRRMIFNLVYANLDDHLKNHSFRYDQENDKWHLAPAYDITYALNPLLHFTKTSRALSINGKRTDIVHSDILELASKYTIRDAKGIIKNTINGIDLFRQTAKDLDIEENVIAGMMKGFWKGRG